MKTNLLILLSFLYIPLISFSNAHVPITLKTLIEKSDLIIVGKVISTYEVPHKEIKGVVYLYDSWIANVSVLNVIKGDEKFLKNKLKIEFAKNVPCTGSANYDDSLFVVSFLKISDNGNFQTIGTYGVVNVNQEGVNAYKEIINEFKKVQIKNGNSNSLLVDWLIKCLKYQATKWDGAYELCHKHVDKYGWETKPYTLSRKQKYQLRSRFLKIEQLDYADIDLIPLFFKKNDAKLLKFLASKIDTTYKDNTVVQNLMSKMTTVFDYDKLCEIKSRYDELYESQSKIRSITSKDELEFEKNRILIYREYSQILVEIANGIESKKLESKKESTSNYLSIVLIIILFLSFGLILYNKRSYFRTK